MQKRVERAIDIFLDAIANGTLAKATCTACAVGNLVAHGMGIKVRVPRTQEENCTMLEGNEHWMKVLESFRGPKDTCPRFDFKLGRKNIKATEFKIHELDKIEKAFEENTDIFYNHYHLHTKEEIREDQIKGLEAVVKVMLSFDESKDDVKEVFTKKADLIPV